MAVPTNHATHTASPRLSRARRKGPASLYDDEMSGACLCPEFARGRRELHTAGQPGCVDTRLR